tara:strand:+ start:1473 stop:2021 length:549 start_codon:yes stop_codon:yes gene_type:complete
MAINWGGIADGFTFGLTDFDKQGSSGWQFGGSNWGEPSIGTQVGAYPGSQAFLNDYFQNEFGGNVGNMFGGSGTQGGVAPTPGKSFSFSNATAPAGSSFVSSDYGSGGAGKIGSWYVDPGSSDMLAEAMIRQKYTPLQRTWHRESYGPGGGSGGGSSTGDAIKGLAGQAINLLGGKILSGLG